MQMVTTVWLDIERDFPKEGNDWSIVIPEEDSKTGIAIEFALAEIRLPVVHLWKRHVLGNMRVLSSRSAAATRKFQGLFHVAPKQKWLECTAQSESSVRAGILGAPKISIVK
jgi:hypothetical protein